MYKKRVAILLSAMGLVFLALLGRLFVLQIVNGQQCRDEYEQSLTRQTFFSASRGAILDRNGIVLARDNVSFEFCMDYGLIAEDPAWIRQQQRALRRQLSKEDAARVEEVFQENMERSLSLARQACGGQEQFETVRRQIVARVERIAEIINDRPGEVLEYHALAQLDNEDHYRFFKDGAEGLPGVAVRHGRKRDYPAGEYACHVIGQIAPVSRDDLAAHNLTKDEEPDALRRALANYRPTDIIGESGVEMMCESVLRPRRGYESTTAGQRKQFIAPHDGQDVYLTLDMRLQVRLTEMFRETYPYHNGAIAVMDVASGEILAMVSIPTYNLQTHRRRVSESALAEPPPPRNSREWVDRPYGMLAMDDYDFPLHNRCVQNLYAPGSTFKPLIAAAALTEGVLSINRSVDCRGRMWEDHPTILKCTGRHGPLELREAIGRSCNVYFYWCGDWLFQRNERLLPDWIARFGMLSLPGTGLPEEKRGVLNLAADRTQRRRDSWMVGIGEGPISVTPLHVLNLMATIARDGEMIRPTIVRAGAGDPAPQRIQLPVAPEHIRWIREGMYRVTAAQRGTAFNVWNEKGGRSLGFDVCGKSGTAKRLPQTRTVIDDDGTRRLEVLRRGNMTWFAGFAPAQNPKVAFVALVEYVPYPGDEHADTIDDSLVGGGASVAGPLCIEALKVCKELGYFGGK